MMETYSKQFTFTPIPKEKFDPLGQKETAKYLEKWGLKERINLQVYHLNHHFGHMFLLQMQ